MAGGEQYHGLFSDPRRRYSVGGNSVACYARGQSAIANHFRVRTGVVVNKADINPEMSNRIEAYAAGSGRDWLGRIRYDAAFTQSLRSGFPVLEIASVGLREGLEGVWNAVERMVRSPRSPFTVAR